jgi:hypothetical protein
MNYKMKKDAHIAFVSGNQPRFDGNTFSVRTEPGVQALKLPDPIPLLGADNPYVDVRYEGDMNIADNTVAVAAMDQNGSEWHKFDCVDMRLAFNYLGLGMKQADRNNAYNIQFRITQQDAISAAYASQLTELEFMALMIQSDIPEMEGFNEGKYTGSGQFAYLVFYQAFMQNVAAIMGKYSTLMSYNDYLVKMGYDAEAHMTIRLINILKKQNVWTLFEQAGNLLQSEFFDLDFYREITAMNTIPCRQRHGIDSPLLSLTGVVNMPDVLVCAKGYGPKAKPTGATSYSDFNINTATDDQLLSWLGMDTGFMLPDICTYTREGGFAGIPGISGVALQRAQELDKLAANYSAIAVEGEANTYTIQQLFAHIMDLMSFPSILKWARETYFGAVGNVDPAKAYANRLIKAMIALVGAISHFRSDTSDLVTFLRVLQSSTSMNNWVLDTPFVKPSLPRAQASPVYFKLVYDILTSYGTSGEMLKDDNTRGWAISTWWHADEGIPKYDAYDGGLTIAASIRGIPAAANDVPATYRAPEYMIPVLFSIPDGGVRFLNRRGKQMNLTTETMTAAQLRQSNIFASCDLMDLPAAINIPTLDYRNKVGYDTIDFSQAARALGLLYGIGRVITTSAQTNDFLDPRMEGLIGREFMNCNTMALNYINNRAPFKMTSGSANIGFSVR